MYSVLLEIWTTPSDTVPNSLFDTLEQSYRNPELSRRVRKNKPLYDHRLGSLCIEWMISGRFERSSLNPGILHLYKHLEQELVTSQETDNTIAFLAVPSYLSPTDFLSFLGSFQSYFSHIRIFRDSIPARYLVFAKTRDSSIKTIIEHFNGRPFSALEPLVVCHVVPIHSIHIRSREIDLESVFPNDHLPPPDTQFIELPTCAVCLERMDSSASGLLTIICSHTFHCNCLSQWEDASCPVCRYAHSLPESPCICTECQSQEMLWVCLICGNVGCGRYQSAHAFNHYKTTGHVYALELETQRVWDYAGDGYVHRIVQNKSDGKLVQLPDPSSRKKEDNEKLELLSLEYSYLLTSQLESQRFFFEKQIEDLTLQLSHLEPRPKATDKQKIKRLEKEISEERMINSQLIKNQEEFQRQLNDLSTRLKLKDEKIADLEEQLRDVMFYLESQEKVRQNPELELGSVSVRKIKR